MPLFHRTTPYILIGFLSLIFSEAWAETYSKDVMLTGEVETTKISGYRGTPFDMAGTSTTRAINGFITRERRDQECSVMIRTENINDSTDDGKGLLYDLCGGVGKSRNLSVHYQDLALSEKRVFVSGVRLCLNKKGNRMKGIQIRGKKVTDDGKTIPLTSESGSIDFLRGGGGFGQNTPPNIVDPTSPMDTRVNCHQDEWKRWAECPHSNQIATGAILHFEAGKKPRALTGIELKCRHAGFSSKPHIERAGK